MGVFKIKIFASDRPDDPIHADAMKGIYEFYVLTLDVDDIAEGEIARKADNTLENNVVQRTIYNIEFVPFYRQTQVVDPQHDMNELVLLLKMLRQPYLVIVSCDLPEWTGGPTNMTNEYPLPAVVRWDYEPQKATNKEDGIVELSISLESLYTKGVTPPTPITNLTEYTY